MARTALFTTLATLWLALGSAQAQEAEPYEADPPDRAARLALIRGDVSLQPAGEEEWAPAQLNRPLTTGDKLWTERSSRVEIQVSQMAIRLDGETGFSFLDLNDDVIQMRMTAGTLIVDVRDLAERETLEIGTPNVSVAILRPGSYRVEVNEAGDITTVKVGDGEAEARGPSQNVIVRARQAVTFRGDDDLVADWSPLGPPDEFDDWSMERERRLERLASSRTAEYVSPEVTGYDELEEHGTWTSEPDYGYVWTPRVSVGWSPYRYGRWVWISPWGWSWIDDAPWGYAPFHYGRWAHIRHRWCWVPGPRHHRAIYAPALVGWAGSRGSFVSWYPLGPRDVYVPHRRHSRHYVERVNTSNAAVARELVREFYERRRTNSSRNRVAEGITSVPRTAFTTAQRVSERHVRLDPREISAGNEPETAAQLAPGRESRLGGMTRARPRIPQSIAERPVIVRRAPSSESAFARRLAERADARQRFDRPDRPRVDRPSAMSTPPQAAPPARTSVYEPNTIAERVRQDRERQVRAIEEQRLRSMRQRPPRGDTENQERWRAPRESKSVQREREAIRQRESWQEGRSEPRPEQPRVQHPRFERRVEQQPREQPRAEQRPRMEQPRVERPPPQPRAEQSQRSEQPSRPSPPPKGHRNDGPRPNRQ
jgi:hypothetical protein